MVILLPHYFLYAFYAFLAGIKHRIAFDVRFRGIFLTKPLAYSLALRKQHLINNYLDLLRSTGREPRIKQPVLAVCPDDEFYADRVLKGNNFMPQDLIIGIAPGATYGPAKRWPKEQYAELADKIVSEYNAKTLIFIGPEEIQLAQSIAAMTHHRAVVVEPSTNLRQTACLLRRCAVVICNDSGLMHISAAVGVKTVSIFGSTSPEWTKPCGCGHTILKKQLRCSPCFARKCKYNTYTCLKLITVEEVFGAVKTQVTDAAAKQTHEENSIKCCLRRENGKAAAVV